MCVCVVKLLSKRWWIPIGLRPEELKLEPGGPRAEVEFPTTERGFSSIQGTLFGFYGIQIVSDAWILPSRVVNIAAKKVLDLNCKVQDLLLEVVDLK